ncbi:Ribosomal silencing factor RsfS [Corynebacterium ciconiae DSM 44920]|uniref:ribosome silencing factor n=1 Tax=Corynebacterium ciconiae TaxID=227319 RepID=UPI000382EDD2|nr:ribosome silencing factor [Corynebacterium ciconiae]WKD60628.1 Ribosomal silencing factor RsfS [Corynebacterium ciconiae DSM 44920]
MTARESAKKYASIAALAASEKLAEEIAVIDVSERLAITECFVIASADNERQVNAIVEEVEDQLAKAGRNHPTRREGTREGRWALLDYEDIVVHIFRGPERQFYGLDRLWADCPLVDVEGLETLTRPEDWGDEVDIRQVSDINQIPLAGEDPSENEI